MEVYVNFLRGVNVCFLKKNGGLTNHMSTSPVMKLEKLSDHCNLKFIGKQESKEAG